MSNKLVETIRVVVQSEMSKNLKPLLKEVLKPLVKEMVESQVNNILAEKFVKSLGTDQTLMKEQAKSPPKKENNVAQLRQMEAQRKSELLKRLGVENDPMAQLIYEDVDVSHGMRAGGAGSSGQHLQVLKNGQVYDPEADDEGVDLSALGL